MCSLSAHRRLLTLPKCSVASEAILGVSNLFAVKISDRKLATWGPQRMQESQLDFLSRGPSHLQSSSCLPGMAACAPLAPGSVRNQALFIKSLKQIKSQFEQIIVKCLMYTRSLCVCFFAFFKLVFVPDSLATVYCLR